MFEPGEKVVCIDDRFDPKLAKLFTALPKSQETNRRTRFIKMNAAVILDQASSTIKSRGEERDKGSERSMRATVDAFNALTGQELTETQGWQFMAILKLARANGGAFKMDDYLDGAAYMALAGECEHNAQES